MCTAFRIGYAAFIIMSRKNKHIGSYLLISETGAAKLLAPAKRVCVLLVCVLRVIY